MPNLEVMVSWGNSTTLGPLRGVEYWGDGIVTCCAVMMNIQCFVGSKLPCTLETQPRPDTIFGGATWR
jgi:hypothetical protein